MSNEYRNRLINDERFHFIQNVYEAPSVDSLLFEANANAFLFINVIVVFNRLQSVRLVFLGGLHQRQHQHPFFCLCLWLNICIVNTSIVFSMELRAHSGVKFFIEPRDIHYSKVKQCNFSQFTGTAPHTNHYYSNVLAFIISGPRFTSCEIHIFI